MKILLYFGKRIEVFEVGTVQFVFSTTETIVNYYLSLLYVEILYDKMNMFHNSYRDNKAPERICIFTS